MYYWENSLACPFCNEKLQNDKLCKCYKYQISNVQDALVYLVLFRGATDLYYKEKKDKQSDLKSFKKHDMKVMKMMTWEEYTRDTYDHFFLRESMKSFSTHFYSVVKYELTNISKGLISLFRLIFLGYSQTRKYFIIKNYINLHPEYQGEKEYDYFLNMAYERDGYYYRTLTGSPPRSKLKIFQLVVCIIAEILYLSIPIWLYYILLFWGNLLY